LIFSEDPRGGGRRQPVAGDGPHGGGSVVDVVVVSTVVDVVEVVLDDELLIVDVVLVVVDVVLVVEVLLVELDVLEEEVVELVVEVLLVVVDVVLLVDDVLVLDEVLVLDDVLVVEEVLVVVDVLLVVEVVLVDVVLVVEVVVDDDVVVGGPPISQFVPEMPDGQMQRYVPVSVARQVPPFRHGLFGIHGSAGSVVLVVVPAVHADEPGGADVPGAQAVQTVAPPVENVSAGQARHSAAPSAAA